MTFLALIASYSIVIAAGLLSAMACSAFNSRSAALIPCSAAAWLIAALFSGPAGATGAAILIFALVLATFLAIRHPGTPPAMLVPSIQSGGFSGNFRDGLPAMSDDDFADAVKALDRAKHDHPGNVGVSLGASLLGDLETEDPGPLRPFNPGEGYGDPDGIPEDEV